MSASGATLLALRGGGVFIIPGLKQDPPSPSTMPSNPRSNDSRLPSQSDVDDDDDENDDDLLGVCKDALLVLQGIDFGCDNSIIAALSTRHATCHIVATHFDHIVASVVQVELRS